MTQSPYNRKRRFDETPEPTAQTQQGDVDPAVATVGRRFVIHQHYATRLHHDLRLEMFNGATPVLVSWAIPRLLPRRRGERHLAVRTEDHPIEYATFTGAIPEGNYGAGEVRIFDAGEYEIVDRDEKKLSFRMEGERIRGVYHLVHTRDRDGKQEWLALIGEDLRAPRQDPPAAKPMLATPADDPFDDPEWSFEPKWDGVRAMAVCHDATSLISRNGNDITADYPELANLYLRLVAIDAMLDGEIVAFADGLPSFQRLQSRMHVRDRSRLERLMKSTPVTYMAFDLIYLDGRRLTHLALIERRRLLETVLVPSARVQVSPSISGEGIALFDAAKAQSLAGIVAKKASSRYEPGNRSRWWLMFKTVTEADDR
ncbi:MAG: ATP-dependent DNA ligase [Actinomycetota bacterium]